MKVINKFILIKKGIKRYLIYKHLLIKGILHSDIGFFHGPYHN